MREEKRSAYTALACSLALHGTLFFAAAFLGIFTLFEPHYEEDPVTVELADEATGDGGGAGGGSPAPVPPAPDVPEIVIPDRKVPPADDHYTRAPENSRPYAEPRAGVLGGRGGEGGGTGVGKGHGRGPGSGTGEGAGTGGGTGAKAEPPPPAVKERIEASLAAEAIPTYPPRLIEDDIEGSVTIRINVAEDGSIESVDVVSPSGYAEMDAAAVAAGWRFRFHPGDGGRKGKWTKTFRFRLN